MSRRRQSAFTLVELLVVITIIGILVALLMPAVQSAREAALNNTCKNNLRQLAVACISHRTATGYYPSGGWGSSWVGDPELGFGPDQPGGWIYSILPHMEQQPLFQMPSDADIKNVSPIQRTGAANMLQITLTGLHCPTRRKPRLRPVSSSNTFNNADTVKTGVKTDYAGNAGTFRALSAGPSSMTAAKTYNWYSSGVVPNGVIYLASAVRESAVRDGTTHTILCGEKYLNNLYYESSAVGSGDELVAYSASNNDLRWVTDGTATGAGTTGAFTAKADRTPLRDRETLPTTLPNTADAAIYRFGGPHVGGWNAALCDGSVHFMSYSIDPEAYRRLGNRADDLPIPSGIIQ